jgi:DnaJ-class molecular chaperone
MRSRDHLPDHYATLSKRYYVPKGLTLYIDVPVDADRETIREAYKRAAFANHPDRAVNEEDRRERTLRFQNINEAHFILSNDQRVLFQKLEYG